MDRINTLARSFLDTTIVDGVPTAPDKVVGLSLFQVIANALMTFASMAQVEIIRLTYAELTSAMTTDGQLGMVIADSDPNKDGIYQRIGGVPVKIGSLDIDTMQALITQAQTYVTEAQAAQGAAASSASDASAAATAIETQLANLPALSVGAPFYGTFSGSTNTITLPIAPLSASQVQLFVGGLAQPPSIFTVSGTTLTLPETPSAGTPYVGLIIGSSPIQTLPLSSAATTLDAQAGIETAKWTSPARVKDALVGMAFPTPVTGNPVTLNNRFQTVYDLKAEGAPCNGSDDDYPTFLALYNTAKAAGGGCIRLPRVCRFNSENIIDTANVAVIANGAGASRILVPGPTQKPFILSGPDVHSIEMGHFQIESMSGGQTQGGYFSFEAYNANPTGTADWRGCMDVKIHHITTFNGYHMLTTAFSTRYGATLFNDITLSDFELRDMKMSGINMTMAAGTKVSKGVVSFTSPGSAPLAGSAAVYFGDWCDGAWVSDINALGSECCLDLGSDWSSGNRAPAQLIFNNFSGDSGYIAAGRMRAGWGNIFNGGIFASLVGSGYGFLHNGGSRTTMIGTRFGPNGRSGFEYNGGGNLLMIAPEFVSASQFSAGTYNGALFNTGSFSVRDAKAWSDSWFSSIGQAYGAFIAAGLDNFDITGMFSGSTGGLFNGSGTSSTKVVSVTR